MITIATVSMGNYRGQGARYVNALFRGCSRHLTVPFKFVCFTDDASGLASEIEVRITRDLIPDRLQPIYYKLALFRPEAFTFGEQVLYLDLDLVILSNIDDIAGYCGRFALLQEPLPEPFGAGDLNTSIMIWRHDHEHCAIWTRWVEAGYPKTRFVDQSWIADAVRDHAERLQYLFPGRIRAFTVDCWGMPPPKMTPTQRWMRWFKYKLFSVPYPSGASIVYFLGNPKQDGVRRVRWVQRAWNDT